MPTYEYICRACGHEFEEFQSIKAEPTAVCPKCRKKKVDRKISGGGAVIFKGRGFYETDYRSESYKSGADAEKKAGESKPDATPASEAKSSGDSKSSGEAKSTSDSKQTRDSKSTPNSTQKPDATPSSKSSGESASNSAASSASASAASATAAAADNKRIESRATHPSRIGRGVGNVAPVAKKSASKRKK
jgi:putative FmdB family regulatory protein